MTDFKNIQFDFTVPTIEPIGNYDVDSVKFDSDGSKGLSSGKGNLPNLRMSQLGLTDMPEIEDVAAPTYDFNAVPDFTVPPVSSTVDAPAFDATSASMATSSKKNKKQDDNNNKSQTIFDMTAPLHDNDTHDDAEFQESKLAAAALLEAQLQEPMEEIDSFPRGAKNPKKIKRDQEDIPKELVVAPLEVKSIVSAEVPGGREPEYAAKPPATAPQSTRQPTQASRARPLVVEEGGADIAKLLYEGAASLEPPEVEQALQELGQAFLEAPNKCAEAVDLGGHGIIVVTMKKWINNKKIQQVACECIHNLLYSYQQSAMQVDIFDALAVMGAMETIINSMDKFPESLGVQRFGLAALGNLLCGSTKSDRLYQRTRKAVEELDAITTVVGGMRRFPPNTMVQGCGCIVLSALLKVDRKAYKTKMIEAGALLDIAAAVTNHSTCAIIEKEASAFLKVFFGWQAPS